MNSTSWKLSRGIMASKSSLSPSFSLRVLEEKEYAENERLAKPITKGLISNFPLVGKD